MIKNRKDFVGRKEEGLNIFARLQNKQSCSIVGDRRIGKSSLLWHISQTASEILDDSYFFFYHDLQNAKYHSAFGFFRTILKDLQITTDLIKEEDTLNKNLVAFTEEIEKLNKTGKKIVFCFDEFESLFRHPNEFTNDFFDHFRSEINSDCFALLTTSKTSLQNLCLEGKLVSPFYNVFTVTELKEFKLEEAGEFLELHYQKGFLTNEDLIFVFNGYEDHFWHPLKLQITCDCLYQNRHLKLPEAELLEKIEKEFGNYFIGTFAFKNWRRTKKVFCLENIKLFFDALKSGQGLFKN